MKKVSALEKGLVGVLEIIRYETDNTLTSKMIVLTLRQCCKLYIWVLKHIALTYCLYFSPQTSGTWYLGIPPSLVLVCFLWFSTSSSWFSITASTESHWTMSSKTNHQSHTTTFNKLAFELTFFAYTMRFLKVLWIFPFLPLAHFVLPLKELNIFFLC